ncbi:MAG: tetratricopeptide repeat protein, partial [Prochlorococcaceae cyanobacterium]
PENADFLFARGYARDEMKDYPGSIADYDKAIALNPSFASAYYNRGFTMANGLRNYPAAIADYDRAIDLDPTDPAAHQNRGRLRNWTGDQAGALADANRALALDPKDNFNHIYFGEIIFLQGRTAEGCASFRKGVSMSSLQEVLKEAKPPLDPAYLKACR